MICRIFCPSLPGGRKVASTNLRFDSSGTRGNIFVDESWRGEGTGGSQEESGCDGSELHGGRYNVHAEKNDDENLQTQSRLQVPPPIDGRTSPQGFARGRSRTTNFSSSKGRRQDSGWPLYEWWSVRRPTSTVIQLTFQD